MERAVRAGRVGTPGRACGVCASLPILGMLLPSRAPIKGTWSCNTKEDSYRPQTFPCPLQAHPGGLCCWEWANCVMRSSDE